MELEWRYIGWCNEVDRKGSKHDKVWASFRIGKDNYCCWGARGKSVNFKKHDSLWDLEKVEDTKRRKYDTVGKEKILDIWPDFYDSVEQRLCFKILANKIK